MVRSQSTVSSLVVLCLVFAGGCSSEDAGGVPTLRSGMLEGPAPARAATSGGDGAPSDSPKEASGESGADVPDMVVGDDSESMRPIAAIDPGAQATGPAAGGEGTETEDPPEVPTPTPVADVPVDDNFVEDNGLDCAVGDLPDAIAANTRVPNPFSKLDGTLVTTRQDWRCRRKEIRAMAERYVYGPKPGKPESVTGSVTNNQITVDVADQGNTASFSATITLPTIGSAPYPAVFSVGGSDQNMFLSQGVAIINFNPNTVGQERQGGGSAANRQNKTGAFYTIYGAASPTGLLAAWAWGVSRYIDVIEASDGSLINTQALAVMGCSRNGKAAFAIGALDERIALSVPFESGTAGVPLFRAVAQAEVGDNNQPSQSLNSAFNEQAWFGDAFGAFLNSATTIPMDTHEIVGLFAPRGLLILDNPFIGELTPRGAHATALAGVEVYKALGAEGNFAYHSDTANGTHCSIRPEYQEPLRQAIQKHLLKSDAAAGGTIQTSQTFATADALDWIDWETPILE
jgi:hypothetical protein